MHCLVHISVLLNPLCVSCYLLQLHPTRYSTGFQARSKDQEILGEGGGAGLSKLDLFCFELSKLFVNRSATDIVFVTLFKHSS